MRFRHPPLVIASLALLAGCGSSPQSKTEPVQASLASLFGASSEIPSLSPNALQDAAQRDDVKTFYADRNWQAAWSPAAEQALRKIFDDRAANGLDHVTFLADILDASPAKRDTALTAAALTYAAILEHGLTDPSKLHDVYTIPRPKADGVAGLEKALAGDDLQSWFDGLAPQSDAYRTLSKVYLDQRAAADKRAGTDIREGGLIHVGESDPRIPSVEAALRENGYYVNDAATIDDGAGAHRYTKTLATAVKQLQTDYGIRVDGVIGPDTLTVLNTGPADRAEAIAVAMERLRWLTRTPPTTRIDVNTAAATLAYYRDGSLVDSRDVIVGQPGKETPQLQAPIFRLVANPTWTVPRSIQKSEMAGKSSAYFREKNLEWRDGWIVQKSGPDNALGLVKFDMNDDQAIYLHDTSAPSLFDRNARQMSHGCVRVSDALGFANMLAQQEGIDQQWQKAREGGEDGYLKLPNKIPVRLLYHTVFVDPAGTVQYRTDPYGWNRPIAKALGFTSGSKRQFRSSVNDVGP